MAVEEWESDPRQDVAHSIYDNQTSKALAFGVALHGGKAMNIPRDKLPVFEEVSVFRRFPQEDR